MMRPIEYLANQNLVDAALIVFSLKSIRVHYNVKKQSMGLAIAMGLAQS